MDCNDLDLKNEELRKRAETLLKKTLKIEDPAFSEYEMIKLVHELKVHQIELELQNEALLLAKEEAVLATEKYAELYNDAPSGYYTLSHEGDILNLNTYGAQLLGKERPALLNNRFGFFVSNDTREAFNTFLDAIFSSKNKEYCEVIIEPKSNQPIYVQLSGIVSKDEAQCFIIGIDISARKKMELELVEAKEKAEASDRLQRAFLNNMSHEIRTPMNAIIGFSSLLQETITDKESLEYLSIIINGTQQLLSVINDITAISRLDVKKDKANNDFVHVNELLSEMQSVFQKQAMDKKITLTITTELPCEQAVVNTDRSKLTQILSNLLVNALKFTDSGSIEFGYHRKDEMLVFYVKDSGIGIEGDMQSVIFERFKQVEQKSRFYSGTGLGLSISQALVELLGGTIWVESELGKGATFYFTIPYQIEPAKVISCEMENPILTPTKKLKILIAEDDAHSTMYITAVIGKLCSELLTAVNGIEALALCKNNPDIDLILMDLQMPKMSGYEAIREIRKFNKEVLILVQTAFDQTESIDEALKAGCNGYISKPYSNEALYRQIMKTISKGS